jgi:hypothetical protein
VDAPHPLLNESVCTFAEAAASIPQIGSFRVGVKSLYNWRSNGVKVGDGRVKLESAKIGGRVVTSKEALARFLAATSGSPNQPIPRNPTTRRQASDKAASYIFSEIASI